MFSRGFFFGSFDQVFSTLKSLLCIIGLLVVSNNLSLAQDVRNIYANLFWIADDVTQISGQDFIGSSLRGNPIYVPSFHATDAIDTNAYSTISYDLGGNANQRLQANLERPLSKKARFFFVLDRHSYPGWMTSSFSRATILGAGVIYTQQKGMNYRVNGGVLSRDREMNGGLTGTQYGFANDGFSDLANDVWFNNAFIRDQSITLNADVFYAFSKTDTSQFSIGLRPTFNRERFVYENNGDDSLYYESFGRTVDLDVLADSSQLLRAENEIYMRYSWKPDSIRSFELTGWLGLDLFGYQSNDLRTDFVNNRVGGELLFSGKNLSSTTTINSIFQGFNAGDASVRSHLRFNLFHTDSTRSQSGYLLAKLNAVTNRAPLVFERYRSQIEQRSLDLNRMTRLEVQLSYEQRSERFRLELGASFTSVSGWTYFNDRLDVQQRNAPLTLIAPFIKIAHRGEVLQAAWSGRYQYHERSKVYSLPDWVSQAELALRFPLFKERIYMNAGVEGWYFSGYIARGYVPMYDQFFVQSTQRFEDYLQVNPRISARIQTVDVALSYMNANYGFTSNSPLVAPGYPSVPRFVMLNIKWRFKN